MTTSKELFQQNKYLNEQWSGISTSHEFKEVLIHARAALMECSPSEEQIKGANRFINILLDLPAQETVPTDMPSPKIVHDLGIKRNTPPK